MNKQTLNIFNAAVVILVLVLASLAWFYMREQFMWSVLLIVLIILFAGYVNVVGRVPWKGLTPVDAGIAVAALLVLAFVWFYLREQFCWAGNFVVLLLVVAIGLKLVNWLRDVVSIQVIVHKKEKDSNEDKK
jgi:hypothetical protein